MLNVQSRYALRQEVDDRLDEMIVRIRKLVDTTRVYESGGMQRAQFSNFSNVVRDTNSVEAVRTWIQYQIGRARQDAGWQMNGFGDKVLAEIDRLEQIAEDIATRYPGSDREKGVYYRQLRIALLRQFAGHLERYFYYRSKSTGGNRD